MKLLLIGCGNIGSILLEQWSKQDIFTQIVVIQPSLSKALLYKNNDKIKFLKNLAEIADEFMPDMIVLSIKPEKLQESIIGTEKYIKGSIFVSLLAAITIKKIEYLLGKAKIVRIMPNIAISAGLSTNLVFANNINNDDIALINKVFISSGKMNWLEKEEFIDSLTPIAGSGPAYFFLLAEIMVNICTKLGLEENLTRDIVQQTLIGTAMISTQDSDYTKLISTVTSKGGVTEAALQILKPELDELLTKAINAGINRIKELQK
jgi:pyrroline-5-carboxylate reductase